MGRLQDKIAIVTGGCSGIGLATAKLFIGEGASVVVADIQDDKGKQLEEEFPGKLRYRHCDVTQESEIASLMGFTKGSLGRLDVLVNNAGAGGTGLRIDEMTGSAWDRTQALLLRSVVLGIRFAVPLLSQRGSGAIVNIASVAGLQAGSGAFAYSVAKAGVLQVTKVAAAQLASHRIRVNAVSPGFIVTSIFTSGSGVEGPLADAIDANVRRTAPESQPIQRAGEPEDVAHACLYLASDAASFVTGSNLVVDGGLTVGPRYAWDSDSPMGAWDPSRP